MNSIKYKLVNESIGFENVSVSGYDFRFFYPCSKPNKCTEYELTLSPGVYKIEVYGGSGGFFENRISLYRNSEGNGCVPQATVGNTECLSFPSMGGAGGYSSGFLVVSKITKSFLSIGGMGTFGYNIMEYDTANCYLKENMLSGGYNGGGSGSNYYTSPSNFGSSGGGGATDFRIHHNDLFHRIIVAGGGGGTDNPYGTVNGNDDGSGGAGGGESAQGFRINGVLQTSPIANQTIGFSFGQGEAARNGASLHPHGVKTHSGNSDRPGGGGGWYGGFSSQHGNGGGGGGSSFILTSNSTIPEVPITVYDEFNSSITTGTYAFSKASEYCLTHASMSSGIWSGNGYAQITLISQLNCATFSQHSSPFYLSHLIYLVLFKS